MGSCAGKGSDIEINDNYISVLNKNQIFYDLCKQMESKEKEEKENNSDVSKSSVKWIYRQSYMNPYYKRDSFDRFGDDFCELILSYLRLEDKMRFECLNKQWNRCIYNRVTEIDYPLERIFPWNFDQKKKLIISKQMMKKCSYVKKLKLSPVVDNDILKLVSENCIFIERIEMRFNNLKPIKREILNAFAHNCGTRLKSIKISKLTKESFNSESGMSLLIVFGENFSNLQDITISLDSDVCLKYFILLTDIYAEKLVTLTLRLRFNPKFTLVEEIFGQISRFCNLKKIELKIESEEKLDLNFSQIVEMLSKSCLDLEDITLEIRKNISCSTTLLKAFESLSDIKTLKLIVKSANLCLGSFESLKGCKNLTEVHVLYGHLNDDLLDNLNSFCPKLISIELLTLQELSDKTLHSLAKIGSLKRIRISGIPYSVYDITDSGVIDVLNKCENLRILDLKCGINVTKRTFSTLKTLAECSPERRIRFSYCWMHSVNQGLDNTESKFNRRQFQINELWPEIKDFPNNLIVNARDYFCGPCGTQAFNERLRYRIQFGNF